MRDLSPLPVHAELRHRGELLVEYPAAEFGKAVGDSDAVRALIDDLYRRIEQDKLLQVAFPHFNSGDAAEFFIQWFGGSRDYSDDLMGGLLRRHQHRFVSPPGCCGLVAMHARGACGSWS